MNAVSEQEITEEFNGTDKTQPEQVPGAVHGRSVFALRIFPNLLLIYEKEKGFLICEWCREGNQPVAVIQNTEKPWAPWKQKEFSLLHVFITPDLKQRTWAGGQISDNIIIQL